MREFYDLLDKLEADVTLYLNRVAQAERGGRQKTAIASMEAVLQALDYQTKVLEG